MNNQVPFDSVPLMVWMSNAFFEACAKGRKNSIIKISAKTFYDANFPVFKGKLGPFPSVGIEYDGSIYLYMCDYTRHPMRLDDSISYGKAVIGDRISHEDA